MSTKIKNNIVKKVDKRFSAKDFNSFRSSMLNHARVFYPDKINDFSEASVGGMFLDLAAVVGDSLTFYMDHMFNELDPELAISPTNVLSHLRRAGVKPVSSSPASAMVNFTIVVPSAKIKSEYVPKESALPVIQKSTVISSIDDIEFILTEDLDFSEKDIYDSLKASYTVNSVDRSGNPKDFAVSVSGLCVSGNEQTDTFAFGGTHVPFRRITLSKGECTEILSVVDTEGNEWYEVESLSQDTVFTPVDNTSADRDLVSHNLEIVPAPRRFVRQDSSTVINTQLIFGSGDPSTLDDDILPDPSDLALELVGKKTFNRFSIDPNNLLKTKTLGMSPKSTTITVKYRHGGGLSHNVAVGSINTMETLNIVFRKNPVAADAISVRQSITVTNSKSAAGGSNPPSLDALRGRMNSSRNMQQRIVTKEDLLARLYSLPGKFGRVFRASIEKNPVNPLSNLLYLMCLDVNGFLTPAPDSLKINISKYLNEFRLVSDAIDIMDTQVINFGIKYQVLIRPNIDREPVLQRINASLARSFDIKYFQIGQPILIDDASNVIINDSDVISLVDLRIYPITKNIGSRLYSRSSFSFENSTKMGIIRPPMGAIFELKYPTEDIEGGAL
jgi:hypothetical protein